MDVRGLNGGGRRVARAEQVELFQQRSGVLRTLRAIFGEQARHEPVEGRAEIWTQLADPGWLFAQHFRQHGDVVGGDEGRATGQTLEKHTAEREDVGASVDVVSPHRLFGRHVADRAEQAPGARQSLWSSYAAHEPEIDDFGRAWIAVDQEQVARLDVAVDDAVGMGGRESLTDAAQEGQRLVDRQPTAEQVLGEILPREPLHDQKRRSRLGGAVGDVAHDRGMAHLGKDVDLARKARGGAVAREQLERDALLAFKVARTVHAAHAADGRELFDQETSVQALAWGQRLFRRARVAFARGVAGFDDRGHGMLS